jgi:DNA-binding Lrp family transcriptional regulator
LVYIPASMKESSKLSEMDKKVILGLQRDLRICPRPFQEVAESVEMAEEELLKVIKSLMERGYIRRFGATLRHQQSGYEANALVAWAVDETDLARIGRHLAELRVVTHCYARRPAPSWPYNLYTMIHGRTPEECVEIAARMAAETGLRDYEMLFSETELKKTTMRYFREGEASRPPEG